MSATRIPKNAFRVISAADATGFLPLPETEEYEEFEQD